MTDARSDLRERLADLRLPPRIRPAIIAALLIVAATGLVLSSLGAASGSSPQPVDFDAFGAAGAAVLTGRWNEVFDEPLLQAGPLQLIFWGIPQLLGVQGAAGWSAFSIITGGIAAALVGLLTHRILLRTGTDAGTGTGADDTRLLGLLAGALAVGSGVITAAIMVGHPAQLAVPMMWMAAALFARRGRPFAAAFLVGLSAGWELWGLLGVAVLLLAPRIDGRTIGRSALGGAAALLMLFGPFVLAGPVSMFGFAWPIYDNSLISLLLPDAEEFTWALRAVQGALSIGAGAVAAVLLRNRGAAVWLVPLAVCSMRLLTDPVVAGYYFTAIALIAAIGLAVAIARRSLLLLLLALIAFNVGIGLQHTGWVGAAVLVVVAGAGVGAAAARTASD